MRLIGLLAQALGRGFVAEIFAHCRNIFIATVFIAAGGFVAENPLPVAQPLGIFHGPIAGYPVAGLGIILLLLNLVEGIYKLSKFKTRVLLDALLIVVYLLFSLRLVQILLLFHSRRLL